MEPIIVHLVHGTWPYGFLRRKPAPHRSSSAWFEDGSDFRRTLERFAQVPITFREFSWSGRNGVAARKSAAEDFAAYLEQVTTQPERASHIIVAHSHGGTIAAHALSRLRRQQSKQVKAFVCLSTPFVYITRDDPIRAREYVSAVAATTLVLVAMVIMVAFPLPPRVPLWALVLGVFLALWIARQFARRVIASSDWFQALGISSSIPIFVLRGTRDEASLSIGVAQSVHALFEYLHQISNWRSLRPNRLLLRLVSFGVPAYATFVLITEATGIQPSSIGLPQFLALLILWGQAYKGALLLLGSLAVAIAVGYWDVRGWGVNLVEADVAPIDSTVTLRMYDLLPAHIDRSFRHGIHEHPDARKEIATVIRRIAFGRPPRLRLDHERITPHLQDEVAYFNLVEDLED